VAAGYIGYHADTDARLAPLVAADPQTALAHCLKGYLAMLSCERVNVPPAVASLQEARCWSGGATAGEQAHIAAPAAISCYHIGCRAAAERVGVSS
jgi:hypothetical protein